MANSIQEMAAASKAKTQALITFVKSKELAAAEEQLAKATDQLQKARKARREFKKRQLASQDTEEGDDLEEDVALWKKRKEKWANVVETLEQAAEKAEPTGSAGTAGAIASSAAATGNTANLLNESDDDDDIYG